MGSCVSVTRDSESPIKMKLSLGFKSDKLVIPPSPVKEKQQEPPPPPPQLNGDRTVAELVLKSQWSPTRSVSSFRDYGSKEETFFDTKAWMDSDCESDFYSVNGDFTPSRGNTPVHPKFSIATAPCVNNTTLAEPKTPDSISIPAPSPTPTEKKKKLLDLFRESVREDQYGDSFGTPFTSGASSVCSSERTANEDLIMDRDKPMRSGQCCLPSLVACRSFSGRMKKKMSPAPPPPPMAVNVEG